jgi:plasmid stabilization system protein ParE
MPRAPASLVKQLEWTPLAASAYLATLSYIASQDPATAEAFKARVDRALAEIVEFPAIGTPAARKGERRFPVPNTGHVLNYRVFNTKIRIQRWPRARQRSGV